MNETVQQLVKLILQKDSIEDCSLQELQNLARQYPYFSSLHLILAEKMRAQHPLIYQKQLQKTSLFFHDPLWFDYLINKEDYTNGELIIKETRRRSEEIDFDEETELITEEVEKEEPVTPPPDAEIRQEFISTNEIKSELAEEIQKTGNGMSADHPTESIDEASVQEKHEIEEHPETENISEPPLPQPELKISFSKPDQSALRPDILTFEPYHTIDYFASQGIKLSKEEKLNDNLGRQLKSFTEWLKSMKKLPQAEVIKNIDPNAEKKVESLAEHSIEDRDVVTEAMAEVWEKQGNHHKAIEIYTKLSLLDPSKSAYFAAKIQQLKKEN